MATCPACPCCTPCCSCSWDVTTSTARAPTDCVRAVAATIRTGWTRTATYIYRVNVHGQYRLHFTRDSEHHVTFRSVGTHESELR